MKKITLLLSLLACAFFTQAQLLVNENFNYVAGTAMIGQGGWASTGTLSTVNPFTAAAPGTVPVTYSGYPSSGVAQELPVANNGQDINRAFTGQTTGFVYVSALVNVSVAQATGDYFLHVSESASSSAFFGRTFIKLDGTKIAFGIQNCSGGTPTQTYTPSTYDLNTTYLLVIKVNVVTGESFLIINPDFSSEPATGWISNASGTTVPKSGVGIGSVNIRQGSSSAAPTLRIDGIHVSTSWTDLFTVTGYSNPSANAFTLNVVGNNLEIKNIDNGTIVEIYSASGQKVVSTKLMNGTIGISKLSKGLYVVCVGKNMQKILL